MPRGAKDFARCGDRVRSMGDGASDDEVIGSCGNSLGRCENASLIIRFCPGRTDSWNHQSEP